jgi:hypothetical protein
LDVLFRPNPNPPNLVPEIPKTLNPERPKQSRKAAEQPKKITAMELEVDDKDLKAAGAEILTDGHHGLRIHGWEIVSYKGSILKSSSVITYSLSFSLN